MELAPVASNVFVAFRCQFPNWNSWLWVTSCHAQRCVQRGNHFFLQLTVDPPTQQRSNICRAGSDRWCVVKWQHCSYTQVNTGSHMQTKWKTLDKHRASKQYEFNLLSSSDRTLFFAVVYWAVRYSICWGCNDTHIKYAYVLEVSLRWSCLCVFARGLTAGVLLAKVLRSLRLVLIRRRVLLIWRLTLWLAAWAISTPRLKHRHTRSLPYRNTMTRVHQQRGAQQHYEVTQSGVRFTKSHISTCGQVCLFFYLAIF